MLASSLDLHTTIAQIAQLTVPRLADLCVVDLLDDDGSIRKVAAASREEHLAQELEALRARQPVDLHSSHPVARVILSGEPALLALMSEELLEEFAQSSEHARFMIEHGYRSAVVAPLRARGRTLGALSLLRLGDGGEPYAAEDLEVGQELARRAALAVDNARLYSDLRAVEQRLEAILANLAEAITVEDEHGQTVFANHAAVALLGYSSVEEVVAAPRAALAERFVLLDERGRELSLDELPGRRLFDGRAPEPLLVRCVGRSSGEERWLVVRSSPLLDPESSQLAFAVNVLEDITGVKRTQLNESFMAEASRVLASSMDYESTLRRIAALAVPQIADWCAIDVVTERGELQRLAAHPADPQRPAGTAQNERDHVPGLEQDGAVAEVIRSGRARLLDALEAGALVRGARERGQMCTPSAPAPVSAIIAPLQAPSRALGAITLVSSQSARTFARLDLELAIRLGRRSGTAVESARLYRERSRIAKTLESALLPESLPEVPGLELAARYEAAGELNDVGGDFYDVFPLAGGRWMLVIGDVCGKGPRAAGVTALVRHTLRTAAILGCSPRAMLQTVHTALRHQPVGADLCTVCLVALEPLAAGAKISVALAGHPPPLLIAADGQRRQVGTPGTLLGVLDPVRVTEVGARLAPGETLLLYTDGLSESATDRQLSERGVLAPLARAADASLEQLLERVIARALGGAERQRDDIALLAVRAKAGRAGG